MSFASLDFSDISAWVHPAEPHCSRPATGAGGWVPPLPLQSLLSPQQRFTGKKVKPCIQRESQCEIHQHDLKNAFKYTLNKGEKQWERQSICAFLPTSYWADCVSSGIFWGTDLCASTGDVAMDGLVAAASLGFGTLQPGSVRHADLLPPSSPC